MEGVLEAGPPAAVHLRWPSLPQREDCGLKEPPPLAVCGSGVTRHSGPTVIRAPRSHMACNSPWQESLVLVSVTRSFWSVQSAVCFRECCLCRSLLLAPLRSLPPSHPFLGYVTGVNLIPLSCPFSFKPSCSGITWAILWPCLQERHRACLHSPEGGKKPLLEEGLSSSRKALPSPPDHHRYLQPVAGVEL